MGRAEVAPSFTGTSKAIDKSFSILGGSMARFLLLSNRLLCWLHAKNEVPRENNDQVVPEIVSHQGFLAKEMFLEPVLRQKNGKIHMANPKCLLFNEPDLSKQ